MGIVATLVAMGHEIERHRPFPRAVVDATAWRRAAEHLGAGDCTLSSLWAEPGQVHMALLEPDALPVIGVLTIACPGGRYPSIGALHPPAIRLERALRDLYGIEATDSPDTRPWLDHGIDPTEYQFLATEGE